MSKLPMMSEKQVRSVLEEIEREIADLERRRNELDRAITRLQRVAGWLRRRRPDEQGVARVQNPRRPSLTNYCRAVLRLSAPRALTPREVRDVLTTAGFDWSVYTNGQAALHTVLKRLVRQQEATVAVDPEGDTRYAVRQVRVIALARHDVEDQRFLKRVLEAESPDALAAIVRTHREKRPT